MHHRPLSATGLRLSEYEIQAKNSSRSYPFGLAGAASTYQNTVYRVFVDHAECNRASDLPTIDRADLDQPTPVVNMVVVRQLSEDSGLPTESLHHVLDESPDNSSEGSTRTSPSYPTFPLGFGGMIFHVSHDIMTREGETAEEGDTRLAENAE